jgi:hypothetical protein
VVILAGAVFCFLFFVTKEGLDSSIVFASNALVH